MEAFLSFARELQLQSLLFTLWIRMMSICWWESSFGTSDGDDRPDVCCGKNMVNFFSCSTYSLIIHELFEWRNKSVYLWITSTANLWHWWDAIATTLMGWNVSFLILIIQFQLNNTFLTCRYLVCNLRFIASRTRWK